MSPLWNTCIKEHKWCTIKYNKVILQRYDTFVYIILHKVWQWLTFISFCTAPPPLITVIFDILFLTSFFSVTSFRQLDPKSQTVTLNFFYNARTQLPPVTTTWTNRQHVVVLQVPPTSKCRHAACSPRASMTPRTPPEVGTTAKRVRRSVDDTGTGNYTFVFLPCNTGMWERIIISLRK